MIAALRACVHRLRGLLAPARVERELAREIDSHVQLHIDDNLKAGMTPVEARRQALLTLGSIEAVKDEYRSRATVPQIEIAVRDLRYAVRMLLRRPSFTIVMVGTLALGVGAAAAMFGLVDALMFRPPRGIPRPERVVRVDWIANYPRYLDIRSRLHALDLAVSTRATVSLGTGPGAVPLKVECVTPSFFPVLGAPIAGRAFAPGEDDPARPRGVVISYRLWRSQFALDPGTVGKHVAIAGRDYTVLGIAPRGFTGDGVETVDAWILLAAHPEACSLLGSDIYAKGGFWLHAIGRIRDGFTLDQAAKDIVAADIHPDTTETVRADGTRETIRLTQPPTLMPIREDPSGYQPVDKRLALWLLSGAGVLLLIACANVAGLLAVRAIERRREIAIRLQLGASRRRVFVQLITENLVAAALCSVAAVLVANWTAALLRAFYSLDGLDDIFTPRTVGVLVAFALASAVLSGLVPAVQATRTGMAHHLRATAISDERARFRNALLIAQVTLALVLMIAAGLFVRSIGNFRRDLAYDLEHVVAASVDFPRAGVRDPKQVHTRYEAMLDRVRQVPGVAAAALSSSVLVGSDFSAQVTFLGRSWNDKAGCCHARIAVSPDYFAASGLRLIKGRSFTAADTAATIPRTVILDEGLAKALFGTEDPIGRCVLLEFKAPCAEVVGVSESARHGALRRTQLDSQFFVPFTDDPLMPTVPRMLVIRSRSQARAALAAIAQAIRGSAPDLPYVQIQPLEDLANQEARSWRLGATMFGLFGALAVALAAVGVYGVLAFSIRQRTPEIGVRIALGAAPGDIARMVLRQTIRLVVVGGIIGGTAAAGLTRYLRSVLFDVSSSDARTLVAAAVIVAAAALAGCLAPAIRATRIDPAAALRAD